MVITQSLVIDAGIAAARARLARLVRSGRLTEASRDAHGDPFTHLIRVGPFGNVLGVSKRVQVRLVGPVRRDAVTTLWLRLQAIGPASGLFPALDGDLTLTAERPEQTRLTLNACYQPPLGRMGAGLDRAVLHRATSATIRALLHRIAATLDEPRHVAAARSEAGDSLPMLRPTRGASDTLKYTAAGTASGVEHACTGRRLS